MAVKIRLALFGRTNESKYRIVVADARAPRDGQFIEKIGTYNPNTAPSQLHVKFDRAIDWLFKGAQPTETVRNLCAKRGILHGKHIIAGIKKGEVTKKEALERFGDWVKKYGSKKKVAGETVTLEAFKAELDKITVVATPKKKIEKKTTKKPKVATATKKKASTTVAPKKVATKKKPKSTAKK